MFHPRSRAAQSLSILIAVSLLITSVSTGQAAPAGAAPSLAKLMAIPQGLGIVTDQYLAGPSAPRVVLIQDLHLHGPTQKRVMKLLEHLYSRNLVSGPLAIEGMEGPFDTSKLSSLPAGKAKDRMID